MGKSSNNGDFMERLDHHDLASEEVAGKRMKTSKGRSFKKPSWFIYWRYPFCIATSHDLENNMKQQNFNTTQMTLKGVLLKIGVSPNHWLPQSWKVRFGRLKFKLWPLVSPILWCFPDSK